MKELFAIGVLTTAFLYVSAEYGLWEDFNKTAKTVHNYEYKALALAKKVRNLEKQKNDLKAALAKVTAEKELLSMSNSKDVGRKIASIPKSENGDLVNYDIYQWSPDKLLAVGEKELHFKHYEKSAQFYNTLIEKFPEHKIVTDEVLFQAGIAAFESRHHYAWSAEHFGKLVKHHPTSKFYRGAKLWLGLSQFYQGNHSQFMATVEEFKSKYRNTKEWKVLSRYYEDLAFNYNNQKK